MFSRLHFVLNEGNDTLRRSNMQKPNKHKISLYRQVFPLQLSLVALLFLAVSCSSLPTHKPLPPEISIAAVKPLNLSLSGQKLMFSLRVTNPNNYDLPLKSMSFIASFAGEDIATGSTNNKVRIPANGEAIVDVAVIAGLNTIINKLSSMAEAGYSCGTTSSCEPTSNNSGAISARRRFARLNALRSRMRRSCL